ncbi:MAG TPA: ferritin-like domain-containing protein [Mycobacteriales bacterium]|nr:ferritin-like domain-containing protein [Mycobacteriales bacterium]
MSLASAATARADNRQAIEALQTAASLETLARANYRSALPLDQVRSAPPLVARFNLTTSEQHFAHFNTLNDAITQRGGLAQAHPDIPVANKIAEMLPHVPDGGLVAVVDVAIYLEERLYATHVKFAQSVSDPKLRLLFISIAGVEAQHLAVLRNTRVLVQSGLEGQIALPPPDLHRLPPAASTDPLQHAFAPTGLARPLSEGAVG